VSPSQRLRGVRSPFAELAAAESRFLLTGDRGELDALSAKWAAGEPLPTVGEVAGAWWPDVGASSTDRGDGVG